ncbi:DEAD/DEAH box helicase [Haploplasma modicum]|uniref:DEAD/DEAH box helicase n=1 Tax=Haploplasma modicum TaxID=2150 RepID=UPI00214CF3BF|nr:DEAD/DEAH box helicase [Haploplasma modicum]MCR1808756.1 DEAD/DEAH box helicase [Haploplasma modicum]
MVKQELLDKLKFKKLTPIQEMVIKNFNNNNNLVGVAPTGTGKTHAYLLPLVSNIDSTKKELQAVILVPTNELINQVREMLEPLLEDDLKVRIYNYKTDKKKEEEWLLNNTPHLVIATPSKLIEMRALGLNLNNLKYLVLDEADMMFDELFLGEIDKIIKNLTKTKYLLFSASISETMYSFIKKYFGNYDLIDSSKLHELNISHRLIKIQPENRLDNLEKLVKVLNPYLAIIFVSKKENQAEIYQKMLKDNYNVVLLSGNLTQHQRKNILRDIHSLKYQYIIASDLVARGIDFDASHIINYDLPYKLEFFKHRSGRTGRMEKEGIVITFATNDERNKITRLREMGFDFVDYRITSSEIVKVKKEQTNKLTKNEVDAIKKIAKPNKVKPNYKKKNKDKVKKALRSERYEKYGKNR